MKIIQFTRLLLGVVLLMQAGCRKDTIEVFNTNVSPDLSNPIIQKLTNITWYRQDFNSSSEEWKTRYNIPKQSEHLASLLYTMAWWNITLHRDGSSVMLFVPPMLSNTYLHCTGKWKVSETEENTIIVTTKTPVSHTSFKLKVLYLETKDNIGYMNVSLDFGNRILTANLVNAAVDTETNKLVDYNWYAENAVSATPLDSNDFENTIWARPEFRLREEEPIGNDELKAERITRSNYITDLLTYTPTILGQSVAFHFEEHGKAYLYYGAFTIFNWVNFAEKRLLYSDARWSIKGNKIIVETEEEFFESIGENMFTLTIDETRFQTHGQLEYNAYNPYMKVRTQKNYYVIEIIKKEANGNLCRITNNEGTFYLFLMNRTGMSLSEKVNIKDILK